MIWQECGTLGKRRRYSSRKSLSDADIRLENCEGLSTSQGRPGNTLCLLPSDHHARISPALHFSERAFICLHHPSTMKRFAEDTLKTLAW